MTSSSTVLFRVEAGPEIGLGHLQRSLSLAAALREAAVGSRFLLSGSPQNVAYVARLGFSGRVIEATPWTEQDVQQTIQEAARSEAGAVVVDSRRVPGEYLANLRESGFVVIVRDDLARIPLPAHILINGNADAKQLSYPLDGGGTMFLLGPEYAVLPSDFWNPVARSVSRTVREVLVLLGGEDPHGMMPGLLRLLDELPGDFTVTAVIGPFFQNRGEIQKTVAGSRRTLRLMEAPACLYDSMWMADCAISGAGQTLYELACVGCPTLAIPLGPDQEGQMEAFERAGFIESVEKGMDGDFPTRVRQALLRLLGDSSLRASMAKAGQRLVDGQGAHRVVQAILPMVSTREVKTLR